MSDRGPFGTIAYQAYGRGLDLDLIDQMSHAAWAGTKPDLVFIVDVDPQLGMARKAGAREEDRFDKENLAFTSRVRDGYLFAASRIGSAGVVIDGSIPLATAFEQVKSVTYARLADGRDSSELGM